MKFILELICTIIVIVFRIIKWVVLLVVGFVLLMIFYPTMKNSYNRWKHSGIFKYFVGSVLGMYFYHKFIMRNEYN